MWVVDLGDVIEGHLRRNKVKDFKRRRQLACGRNGRRAARQDERDCGGRWSLNLQQPSRREKEEKK